MATAKKPAQADDEAKKVAEEAAAEAPKKTTTKKAAAKKTTAKKTTAKKAAEPEVEQAEEKAPAKKAPAKKTAAKKTSSRKSSAKKAVVKVVEEDETGKHLIVDPSIAKSEYVSQALADADILAALVESLRGEKRRARQFSATILAQIARENPEVLVPSTESLVDALHRPEAQTRWEVLDALYELVAINADGCAEAIDGAEVSLYDEENGPARLAALRFMCGLGASDAKLAEQVWPNIDEAIQCYHGDPEFQEMLDALVAFAQATDNDEVRKALAGRMAFDAENGKGALGRKATLIVEACK